MGLYERDCEERGIAIDTFKTSLEHNDRAILEGSTDGFVKIHVKKGTDEILGATIVMDGALPRRAPRWHSGEWSLGVR